MKLIQETAEAAQFELYVAGCFLLHSNLTFIAVIQHNEVHSSLSITSVCCSFSLCLISPPFVVQEISTYVFSM